MTAAATTTDRRPIALLIGIGAGAAVSLSLGVYSSVHEPTARATFTLFFPSMIALKVWFTTIALLAGLFQVFSSLRLYGRIHWPRTEPSWLADAHRLSGTIALAFSLPVAYHCLWALGFNGGAGDTRILVHSIVGCFFYGAFVTKVVFVRSAGLPGAALPVTGGLVFSLLVVLWMSSSLWWLTANPLDAWF
jgi:hypothetical protein